MACGVVAVVVPASVDSVILGEGHRRVDVVEQVPLRAQHGAGLRRADAVVLGGGIVDHVSGGCGIHLYRSRGLPASATPVI